MSPVCGLLGPAKFHSVCGPWIQTGEVWAPLSNFAHQSDRKSTNSVLAGRWLQTDEGWDVSLLLPEERALALASLPPLFNKRRGALGVALAGGRLGVSTLKREPPKLPKSRQNRPPPPASWHRALPLSL